MTDLQDTPEPRPRPRPPAGACPVCGAQLAGGAWACQHCQARLDDPMVTELSDVNAQLSSLQLRRAQLVAALKAPRLAAGHSLASEPQPTGAPASPTQHPARSAGLPSGSGTGTQNLLLGLGVVCLMVAAAVFAAVGWTRLSDAARVTMLLAATAAAYVGAVALVRRGLRATGEAVLVLASLMAAVDTGLLGEGFGSGLADARAWTGGLAAITMLGVASRRFGGASGGSPPLAGGLIAAVTGLLVLPVAVLAFVRYGVAPPAGTSPDSWPWWTETATAALAVALIFQVIVGALALREREWDLRRPIPALLAWGLAASWLAGVLVGVSLSDALARAAVLGGATLAAALAATLPRLREPSIRGASEVASACAAGAGLGAWGSLLPDDVSANLWMAGAGAVLAVAGARGVRGRRSPGVGLVGGCVLAATTTIFLAAIPDAAGRVVEALGGDPDLPVADWLNWADLTGVAALVVVTVSAIWGLRRWGAGTAMVAVGAVAVAVPTAVGLDLPSWSALLAALALASGLTLAVPDPVLRCVGGAVAVGSGALSLALAQPTPGPALALLWGMTAVLAAGATLLAFVGRTPGSQVMAGVACIGMIGGATQSAHQLGATPAWAAATAALTAAALATAGQLLGHSWGDADRGFAVPSEWARPLGAAAAPIALVLHAVAAMVAVGMSVDLDAAAPGATALIAGAVAYLAMLALDRQRRWAIPAGICAQSAEWLLVGLAGVPLLEAYTVPGSLTLVGVGAIAMWRDPHLGSAPALGAGLAMGLVPSTLLALAEGGPRALVTLGVGAALVVAGATLRLAAPLLAGAAAVLLISGTELVPAVASLPRYLTFGFVGAALLITGATFEERRAELAAARRHLRAMR